MIQAPAAHDPAATRAAFDTLTRRHTDRYAASGSQRRSLNGLIDMTSLMYAAFAADRDLPTPTDNPYVPTALLRKNRQG